MKLTSSE